MCISRSRTEISLPSSSMWAHLPGYPRRLVKIWGYILASSYCSRKASTLKCQSVYVTSAPGSVDLKIGISNLVGTSCFLSLLPLWPLHPCQQPAVSLAVVWGRGGQTPSTDCSALGLWWPSTQMRCPHPGGEPCLGHLFHPRGSSGLLRCTSHQLTQGVRLPCSYNWCIMDRDLCPTS